MTKKEKNLANLPIKKVSLFYRLVKRSFDIFCSFIAILLLSPILLILLVASLISSRGHAIFKDKRIGKDHKQIAVYKFRTMYGDAETNVTKYLNEEQLRQWETERKVDNDPRITPFGRFLRASSLDELPQLFNILFGSMTIVGPRPITQKELDDHFSKEQQDILLSARPGLVGYWAVMGRSDVGFSGGREQLELDYFKLRSLGFDLLLIFRAVPAVLKGKGAK